MYLLRQEPFGGLLYSPQTGEILQINRIFYLLLYSRTMGFDYDATVNLISKELKVTPKQAAASVGNNIFEVKSELTGNKIILKEYSRAIWNKPGSYLRSPESVSIRLHNVCNMSCPGCYLLKSKTTKIETSKIMRLIDDLSKLMVCRIDFSGGEVFIDDDIFEIANYAYYKNIFVSVTTNGTFIDGIKARKIANSKIGNVQLSIDSVVRVIFSGTRNEEMFDKVIAGIRNLSIVKQKFGINLLITPDNWKYLESTVKYCYESGAQKVKILRPKPSIENCAWFAENKIEIVAKEIIEKYFLLKKTYSTLDVDCSWDKILNRHAQYVYGSCYGCIGGIRAMAINSDGNVYPCPFFIGLPEYCGGNVNKDNLGTIWNGSSAFNYFREVLVSIGEKINDEGVPNEMFGCRRIALHNGTIQSGDPIC